MVKFKGSYSLFYRIGVKESWQKKRGLEDCILNINGTWVDLELHNYLFHKLLSEFFNDTESDIGEMILHVLPSIAKDIYIHLDILRKIIEDNIFIILQDNNFKKLHKQEQDFWNLIRTVRNNMTVHKEKKFYYKHSAPITGTDPEHLMTFYFYLKPNPENIDCIKLRPLTHIEKMEKILRNYENYLILNY